MLLARDDISVLCFARCFNNILDLNFNLDILWLKGIIDAYYIKYITEQKVRD
jgi:hypothetical protein